jgi:hypothetical protein
LLNSWPNTSPSVLVFNLVTGCTVYGTEWLLYFSLRALWQGCCMLCALQGFFDCGHRCAQSPSSGSLSNISDTRYTHHVPTWAWHAPRHSSLAIKQRSSINAMQLPLCGPINDPLGMHTPYLQIGPPAFGVVVLIYRQPAQPKRFLRHIWVQKRFRFVSSRFRVSSCLNQGSKLAATAWPVSA